MRPVLYSFRRCPYAIRARLALAAAGLRPGQDLDVREVHLQARPPELLAASAKGTVPVLVQDEGSVLDESLAIMEWALTCRDPEGWQRGRTAAETATIEALITVNDGPFKRHLDRFKYAGRYGASGPAERQEHREAGLGILRDWNRRLEPGGWLLGARPSLADVALLPFVRQFRLADPAGFDAAEGLGALRRWLERFLSSAELRAVMEAPWAARSPWRSPGWLYHLALAGEWQEARATGAYRRSTRGRSLQEVGFIHLSQVHQVQATHARFYADLPDEALVLLVIDPQPLRQAGLETRLEPAPGSGELFPHLYGPLPTAAVVRSLRWQGGASLERESRTP